jgi:uncharacterized cupin superfamily protein
MSRPDCVVRVADLPAEQRPRFLPAEGVGARVRALSDAAGLTRMGVGLREIEPGDAGTHRHFHEVEEEWVYVLAGVGHVRLGPHRLPVRAGSFAGFPPGPCPHHFVAGGREPLVLLEGGERRREEEVVSYPDLGQVARARKLAPADAPFPPEEGDPSQCLHIDDLIPRDWQHEVDEHAKRVLRTLHEPAGLRRQAVCWSTVRAGDHSTAYHTHDRTDEWVYVLSGRASVRVGDERFEVESGDFLGHPAGGTPHVMEPITDLEYLMGGQIDPEDIVLYPESGVQRRGGKIEPIPG